LDRLYIEGKFTNRNKTKEQE